MAKPVTIQVVAELQTQAKNIDNFIKGIEKRVTDANISERLFKISESSVNKMYRHLEKANELLSHDELSITQGKQLKSAFRNIEREYNLLFDKFSKANYKELGFSEGIVREFQQAYEEVSKIQQQKTKELSKTKSGDYLDSTLLAKAKQFQGFDANASLSKNLNALREEGHEVEKLITQYGNLERVKADVALAQKALDQANQDVRNYQKTSGYKQYASFENAKSFLGLNRPSGQSYQKSFEEIAKWLEQALMTQGSLGSLTDKNNIAGQIFSKVMGFDKPLDQAEIQAYAQSSVESLMAAFYQKIESILQSSPTSNKTARAALGKFLNNHLYGGEIQTNAAAFVQANSNNAKIQNTGNAFQNLIGKAEKQNAHLTELQNVEARISNAQKNLETVILGISTSLTSLKQKIDEMFASQENNANANVENLKGKYLSGQTQSILGYPKSQTPPSRITKGLGEEIEGAEQALKLSKEAERIKTNLTMGLRRWMGTYQVINLIRRGIRSAYQDITNLDKAMTSIAVVTDYNVSDLWGQINKYMSVAKQYGVTTQGVYEVSQLYFQQGLNETETMAAATETLKMARIAGIDYSEAADGMTVAIRGFNMEMEEAARVTDVYSKVAAITASDTQELVTAMSKTASSAASVGSSFENTTAMLAVMIEATRESPQNLGSALKSIISRYGEMTKGLTEDSEGEEIDYNRVDAALKTIGISLKDAQGQFRNFDAVIEELSAKWDTLDSVTQRYIATIFAGNRQQSRFLALVSNYERYMEVSEAAANSEDAGLLQYSKTLDSLETKLNNIKTSFQQFYMSILNGDNVKGFLEFINNVLTGFTKLSKLTTTFNLVSIISGIKIVGTILVNTFSTGFQGVITSFSQQLQNMVIIAQEKGREIGEAQAAGQNAGYQSVPLTSGTNPSGVMPNGSNGQNRQLLISPTKARVVTGLSFGGAVLSGIGSNLAAKNQTLGATVSGIGNGMSIASMALMFGAGGPFAAVIGGLTAIVSTISSMPSELEKAQQELEKTQQKAEEANIKRAEARERASSLESTIKQLKELEKAQYDSEEAQKAYIDASNTAFERFPELTAIFDEAGNAIIDASNAEQLLASARMAAAQATIEAAVAENKKIKNELNTTNVDLSYTEKERKQRPADTEFYFLAKDEEKGGLRTAVSNQLNLTNDVDFASLFFRLLGLQKKEVEQLKIDESYLNKLSLEEIVSQFDSFQKNNLFGIEESNYQKIMETVLWQLGDLDKQKHYNDYLDEAHRILQKRVAQQQSLSSTEKAIAIAEINDYFTLQDIDQYDGEGIDWQTEIEGATEQFQQIILDSIDYSKIEYDAEGEIILSSLTEQMNLEGLFVQYEELYNQLYQSFQLDEYNELIKNAISKQVSISEYANQLVEIFGTNIPEVVNKGFLDWKEEADKAADNLRTSLLTGREVEWNSLEKDISLIPETFYDEIATFANKIDDLIQGQTITAKQGQAIAESYGSLWNLIYADVDKNLQGIARNLLANADLTSIGGVVDFQNTLEKEGIVLSNFDFTSLISNLSINVVTEYQNLQDKLATSLDEIAKALEDASGGISSVEDTVKMANKLGVSLANFRIEDGKFYFDDINKLQEAYGKDLSDYSEQLSSTLDKYIQQSKGLSDINWQSPESLEEKTKFLKNRIDQLSKEENLDETSQAELESLIIQRDILNQFSSDYQKYLIDSKKGSFTDYLIKYRETEMKAFDEATKQWKDQLITDINYDNAVRELTKKYAGDKQAQKRQEVLNNLISSGGVGLSGSELAQLETDYFGLDENGKVKGTFNAIQQADGSWKISQAKMAELSVQAGNASSNVINETVVQTQEGLDALGEAVAFKKQLDVSEKQDLLGEYAQNFTDEQINIIWSLYEQALISEDGIATLESSLTSIFLSQGKDLATAERMAKESIDSLNDNVEENIQNILDLKLSLLEGSITNTERTILKGQDESFLAAYDTAISASASERASKIFSLYEKVYIEQLIAGDITATEALENTAKAASQQLDKWLGTSLIQFNKEAVQGIEEGDLTQTTDEFGQLFISIRKNTEETLESFYNTYSKGITDAGEIILDVQKLKTDNRISEQEYIQFQRNFAKKTFGSAEDLITRMASKDDVYIDEIESFFEALGAPLQEGEAELLLQSGIQTFLSKIESTLLAAGVPQSDINSRLAEIQAQLVDLLLESISSGISSLGSGLEGTLGAADYQSLAKKYGLTGIGTSKSSKGIRLGTADQQKLISQMFLEAQNAGLSAEFGDQLWEVWRDSTEDAFEGYTDIEETIQEINKQLETTVDKQSEAYKEAEAYRNALQQARHAAMFDENAAEFAFMEQDATDGLTKNFDKFVDNIEKVKDIFSAFKSKEAIGYQDFYNMMDFIGNSEAGFAKFSEMTGVAAVDYEAFVNSVVANTDKWGKVDIGDVAAEMGISVEAAMEGMAEGMTDGLKKVARKQIQYLSGLEAMLEALAALESIGDISLGLGLEFTTTTGETITIDTLNDIVKYWEVLKPIDQKTLIIELQTALKDGNSDVDTALQKVFGKGFSLYDLLGGENFFTSENFDIGTIEAITSLSDLTQGQAYSLAMKMNAEIKLEEGSDFTIDENGIRQYTESGYQKLQDYIKQNYKDFYKVEEYPFDFEVANKANVKLAKEGITIEGVDISGWSEMDDKMKIAVKEKVETAYAEEGLVIEVSPEGKLISTPMLEDVEAVNTNFQTAAEAASTLQTAVTQISTVASTFQAGSGFQSLADQLNAAAEAAGKLISALGGNRETTLPDTSAIEAELAAAQAIYESMGRDMTHGVIPMNYDELDAAQDRVIELQGQLDALKAPSSVATGLITELGSAVEIANQLSNALANNNGTPLEVNFNVDEANSDVTVLIANLLQLNAVFKPTIEIEDKASSVLESIIQLIANISSKTVTITTVHKDVYTTVSSSGNGGINDKGGKDDGGPGPFAGTMNGLAFADGSLGHLHSGAVLANKALVGELGPELAVYDGQYHMLGANGAEFVDLPSDAIIFNHLQTQGILRGQMNIRGTAMAEGNVSGPAFAGGGIGAALAAVSRAKSVWQGLLNSLSAADLMGAGGGGGGGGGDESLKAHIADLQEWYNLSRQIADIEGQINVLLAKRKNITDGHEYLRNLRETQRLLDDQVNTQQDLLRFQELQLQRQAEHINTNKIWSQFLEVDENGLLQYKKGNETNGGKGALEVLSQMNEMSGEEQLAYVQSLGWSYTNTDGEELEDAELVAKFYEELQKQIDDYDALRDTVQETEGTLAELEEQINEIKREIRDNEIDLSKEIYDIIVSAWEENIKNLKEQNDLIKEANEAYANGIQEAIDAERQIYDQNTAISDREQLQRQLALMRRSGGSASEIADLEQQLDDMLKEEYFSNQEKQLETIQKANERQVELMDQQVKLQEEALEYEKENGVIWTKVYEVMQGTDAEILDFMQGNKTDFFEQSTLQQEDMLTEWAKKIGIYTEERQRQNYAAEAAKTFDNVWNNETGRGLQDAYNRAGSAQQEKWKREYNDTYASKMLEGKSHEEALALAQEEFYEHLRNWIKAEEDKKKQRQQQQQTTTSSSGQSSEESGTSERDPNQRWKASGRYGNSQGDRTDVAYGRTKDEALRNLPHPRSFYNISYGAYQRYAKGGIIDYTGPAWVDGSKSKPERILSAEQNRILEEGLAMNAGRSDKLREMFSNFAENLGASVRASISNIANRTNSSAITIQPGAVQLNIEQLNDKYDVDELFNDVADRLYSIASKASGRGVSRR